MAQMAASILLPVRPLHHHHSSPSVFPSICVLKNTITPSMSPASMFVPNKKIRKITASSSHHVNGAPNKSIHESVANMLSFSKAWLMLPSKEAYNHNVTQFHTLFDHCFYDIGNEIFVPPQPKKSEVENELQFSDNVKCVGASHGWLAFLDPNDCALYLANHLTAQIIQLPPIETLPSFGPVFYYKQADGTFKREGFLYKSNTKYQYHETCKKIAGFFVDKIILSSSPLTKDCTVFLSAHSEFTTLACCKIGDASWTNLDQRQGWLGDVIYNSTDKKVYATPYSSDLKLHVWDVSNPSSPTMTMQKYSLLFCDPQLQQKRIWETCPLSTTKHYLVEYSGKLFLVIRRFAINVAGKGQVLSPTDDKIRFDYPYTTLRFHVYEFQPEENKFKYLPNLGEMAFFVGVNHSVAVTASSEIPGINANAVYYADHYLFKEHNIISAGHDFGIYKLGEDSIINTGKNERLGTVNTGKNAYRPAKKPGYVLHALYPIS